MKMALDDSGNNGTIVRSPGSVDNNDNGDCTRHCC